MQLDLGALQNFQSDMPSTAKSAAKGRPTSSRSQKQTSTGAKDNDFQSSLKRAEGYRDIDNQRSDNRDAPAAKIENRSSGQTDSKSENKSQHSIQSTDGHLRKDRVLADSDSKGDGQKFHTAPDGTESLDPNFIVAFDPKAPDSQQPESVSKDIPLLTKPEGDSSTSFATSVRSVEQILNSSEIDPGATVAINKENTDSALISAARTQEIPEQVKLDITAKTSQTTVGKGVTDETPTNMISPQGKELTEKTSAETQNTVMRNNPSHKFSDSPDGRSAEKTLAAEQVGSAQLSKETQNKMESISSSSKKAHADGNLPHIKATTGSNKNPEIENLNRLSAETDRHNQVNKTSSGQGEIRGAQDGASTSVNKFNADGEQNLKINDLISSSQRPAVSEGSSPPSPEQVDTRASLPKTDVLNQIVNRAVFKLNGEQSEVRIDLKPDFLGHVRLQIVTDSHQVNLRILAESSIVKELIDGSLGQLKNDLQAQGLKVDEIEVAVAKDFNDYSRNQEFTAHRGPGKRGFSPKGDKTDDSEQPDSQIEPTVVKTRSGGINCFA
jgi:flagellar hook-length control protein FliK